MLMVFMMLAIVLVAFGAWGNRTLVLSVVLGIVYMMFTEKGLDK